MSDITRQKIIDAAIELFNESGTTSIGTRTICEHLGMSPGNLYYYFKNKEEILLAIHAQIIENLTHRFNDFDVNDNKSYNISKFFLDHIEFEWKYRFFTREMANLLREFPSLFNQFKEMLVDKRKELKALFMHQIKHGYMHELSEMELEFLVSNCWLISTQFEVYWSLCEMTTEKQRMKKGVTNLFFLLKPYITPKGAKATGMDKIEMILTQELL